MRRQTGPPLTVYRGGGCPQVIVFRDNEPDARVFQEIETTDLDA